MAQGRAACCLTSLDPPASSRSALRSRSQDGTAGTAGMAGDDDVDAEWERAAQEYAVEHEDAATAAGEPKGSTVDLDEEVPGRDHAEDRSGRVLGAAGGDRRSLPLRRA